MQQAQFFDVGCQGLDIAKALPIAITDLNFVDWQFGHSLPLAICDNQRSSASWRSFARTFTYPVNP
jgi:hypothetical protein